uniref:testis-specific protein TSX-like isoform X2 n=1 Tax=Jaculus jaculus TaxID=51337 RepID=UPI001E1B154C|nr:testis-specific protein TSX-like isoform X2 [Jaculus jaculus]
MAPECSIVQKGMSEEQKPQLSEAECTPRSNPEMEDEKLWFYKVLGIKPKASCMLDGNTSKQEDNLLNHEDSFIHGQETQEKKVSTEDDENSDSDTDDNVKIIIGHIQTNPSMYMEMLTNLNSQPDQEASTSV